MWSSGWPRVRVIPEWFGGGALPRKELHEAAEELTADQAGLLVVSSEPAIEKALDKALAGAAKVTKHKVDARSTRSPASCRKRSNADRAARIPAPDLGGLRLGLGPGRAGCAGEAAGHDDDH
jgi:hypothetical protein